MNRLKGVALLAACKPLANRLANAGIDIELTQEDLAALVGYNNV